MTVEELRAALDESIARSEAEIEAVEERLAIMYAEIDDGLTTTQRAIEALDRPERFPGEHAVARAWLTNHANPVDWRVFRCGRSA